MDWQIGSTATANDREPGGPRRARWPFPRAWAAGCVAFFLALSGAHAQQTVIGKVTNFRVSPEFYPAPNQKQMKILLTGAEAEPLQKNRVLVKGARLQTFREDGRTEISIETPECVYDPATKIVASPGNLKAFTADGKFSIEGTGFSWEQANSVLVISNAVRTQVEPSLLSTTEREAQGESRRFPVAILADSFRYAKETGLGVYQGNVKATGTNLAMTAGSLTFKLPMEERQLESIEADQDVVVDYSNIHATGGKALYTTASGQVVVTGEPTWRIDEQSGSARQILIDHTNRLVRASGDAFMKLPGQGLGGTGFLAGAAPTNTANVSHLEIRSDYYEIRTNSARFGDQVRLAEMSAAERRGGLSCSVLEVAFAGTNQLQSLTAKENVLIERDDGQFKAQDAAYTEADGQLRLTGNPTWRAGTRHGKGDLITVDTRAQRMRVDGHASMELPAKDLAESDTPAPLRGVLASSSTAASSNQTAEVFSDRYELSRENASFAGGVYISHPRIAWACESLTARLPPPGESAGSLLAEKAVAFDLLMPKGDRLHGRADRASYRYGVSNGRTNDVMELAGNPILETTNLTFRNSVFILDRANGLVVAPGRYHMRGVAPDVDTNLLTLPNIQSLRSSRSK